MKYRINDLYDYADELIKSFFYYCFLEKLIQ